MTPRENRPGSVVLEGLSEIMTAWTVLGVYGSTNSLNKQFSNVLFPSADNAPICFIPEAQNTIELEIGNSAESAYILQALEAAKQSHDEQITPAIASAAALMVSQFRQKELEQAKASLQQ